MIEQEGDAENTRNRFKHLTSSKTNETTHGNDSHLKLIQKLQEDKINRKKREDERRQKTLEKYVKQVEEK